jgi:hypothetical protein
MKNTFPFILLLLAIYFIPASVSGSQSGAPDNDDSFLIHSWFFGTSLPNDLPLINIEPAYGLLEGGLLEFKSALLGYPFSPFHPNWRKASMERRNTPTPINYHPEGNLNISYENANMRGIQIKQPFTGDGGENTLIFQLPSTGFNELIVRFAAKDEGAADAMIIDYAVNQGAPVWITTGLVTNIFPLSDEYQLYEINLTESATQMPPPPPGHGFGDDQLPYATYMLVNDNPDFKIRIRFAGDNMGNDEGARVTFNNFSLHGSVVADDYQVISLNAGWNGISSFILPDNAAIEHIFLPATQSLVIAQNFDGVYWPSEGLNTLLNWNPQTGYAVKAISDAQLLISGQKPENPTLTLGQGWSFLPVLNECSFVVEDLFAPASGQLAIVKEVAGPKVYWPSFGINNLLIVEPGKAYMVLMTGEGTLDFSNCPDAAYLKKFRTRFHTALKTGLTTPKANTLFTHTIAIPDQLAGNFQPGDVISAHDEQDDCFGVVVWDDRNAALTLFGNDGTTPAKDGFNEQEPFSLRLKRPATNEVFAMDVTFDPSYPENSGLFAVNGLSVIKNIELIPSGIVPLKNDISVNISPNPAQHQVVISIDDMQVESVLINIYRMDGSLVKTQKIGQNPLAINIDYLSSGIYILQIQVNDAVITRRLIKE